MPSPRVKLSEPDVRVMLAIQALRDEYHACSFGQLMERCGYQSKVGPQTRCNVLRSRGFVAWTEGVHGSIHLTLSGKQKLARWLTNHPEFGSNGSH